MIKPACWPWGGWPTDYNYIAIITPILEAEVNDPASTGSCYRYDYHNALSCTLATINVYKRLGDINVWMLGPMWKHMTIKHYKWLETIVQFDWRRQAFDAGCPVWVTCPVLVQCLYVWICVRNVWCYKGSDLIQHIGLICHWSHIILFKARESLVFGQII